MNSKYLVTSMLNCLFLSLFFTSFQMSCCGCRVLSVYLGVTILERGGGLLYQKLKCRRSKKFTTQASLQLVEKREYTLVELSSHEHALFEDSPLAF